MTEPRDNPANAWHMYWRYIGASIRGRMQYKLSFYLSLTATTLTTAFEVVVIWALFESFGGLQHWSVAQVCLFYGLVNMGFAFTLAISNGFDNFGALYIRTGQLDRVLLRPRSVFLQILSDELSLRRFGRFVTAAAVTVWAVVELQLQMDVWFFAQIVFILVSVACLFLGALVLQATLSFWTIQSLEFMNVVTYGAAESAQYPLSIYHPWFRNFFTFVVPSACVVYFPVIALLGIEDPLGTARWFQHSAPLAGVVFLLVSVAVFNLVGVRHYKSTGS